MKPKQSKNSREAAQKIINDLKKQADQADEDLIEEFDRKNAPFNIQVPDTNPKFPAGVMDDDARARLTAAGNLRPGDDGYIPELDDLDDTAFTDRDGVDAIDFLHESVKAGPGSVLNYHHDNGPVEPTGYRNLLMPEADAPPDLFLSVFIGEGSRYDRMQSIKWLARSGCYAAETPDEADFVLFLGGPDVHPRLYNKTLHDTTRYDDVRDAADMALYTECLKKNIPMVGICRGAQFLHVAMGGSLIQDLDGHDRTHDIVVNGGRTMRASSSHHQAVLYERGSGVEVLATASLSKTRWLSATMKEVGGGVDDVEAFFYDKTCVLGFQGHPEWADNVTGIVDYADWCLKTIDNYINHNHHVHLDKQGRRRTVRIVDTKDVKEPKAKLSKAKKEKATT